jgi:enamine deaminase RidA (YjgF/YER057c/UK114 family)
MPNSTYPADTPVQIVPPGMENIVQKFNYSPGVRIGNWIYVAGQVGRDADLNIVQPLEAHLVQAWENVGQVLRAAGADYRHIVEMTTWHLHFHTQRDLFIDVKHRYIKPGEGVPPAWSGFEAADFAFPGLEVEIKVVAFVPDDE